MTKQLVIIGDGGHCKVVIDLAKVLGRAVLGLTSLNQSSGETLYGVQVMGDDSVIDSLNPNEVELINGVGSIDTISNKARRLVYERGKRMGFKFATLVHPASIVASDVALAEGVQIMAGAILQAGVKIGINTIINTGAIIDHQGVVGPHCHLAPGVVCSGGIRVGEGSHLGTGASLIQSIQIGANALVAAGAVVVSNVSEGQSVRGIPAKSF